MSLTSCFMGTYRHAVDAKGRLSIPSVFRGLLVTHNSTRSVLLLPVPNEKRIVFLNTARLFRQNSASIQDSGFSHTDQDLLLLQEAAPLMREKQLDQNGRIQLSKHMREHLGLTTSNRNVSFYGHLSHFGIVPTAQEQIVHEKAYQAAQKYALNR